MKKVLLIEDDFEIARSIVNYLEDEVEIEILEANDHTSAEDLIDEYIQEIDLVLMDACLHLDKPNTQGLIKHIRNLNTTVPIAAMSNVSEFNTQLLSAGATEAIEKVDAPVYILKKLGISQNSSA